MKLFRPLVLVALATLVAVAAACSSKSSSSSPAPVGLPVITSFTVSPAVVALGQPVTMLATFSNGVGDVLTVGALASGVAEPFVPRVTNTFTLVVTNALGRAVTATASIQVFDAVVSDTTDGGGPDTLRGLINQSTFNSIYVPSLVTVNSTLNVLQDTTLSGPPGAGVDGGGAVRPFFVTNNAFLTIQGLTISNGVAVGGSGGQGARGGAGGGAAGQGGAIFVNDGRLVLQNAVFTNNVARGGAGGGISGAGGNGGGGGGIGGAGVGGNGGDSAGGTGAPLLGAGATLVGCPSGNGGEGGGGAGGEQNGACSGGNGGFGGGGGGGGAGAGALVGTGGTGGFGGGGGGAGNNGTPGQAGAFGGAGGIGTAAVNGGAGGGGAGLGGAIFVRNGALEVYGSTFTSNSALGGLPGTGGTTAGVAGEGAGGAIFVNISATAVGINNTFTTNGASTTSANVFGLIAP